MINGGFGLVLDGSEVSVLHTLKKHMYIHGYDLESKQKIV